MTPPGGLFSAVLASSVALHAIAFVVLPEGHRRPIPLSPSVIEIADLPPSPPPPPPPPPPDEPALDAPVAPPARAPLTTRGTTANRPSPVAPAPAAAATTTSEAPASAGGPVDFTSSVLSSADGPGVAVPSAGRATTTAASVRPTDPRGPEIVAVSDLSQPPRAPHLDRVLERNYPPDARRSGITGSAVLAVEIFANGSVGNVRRLSQSHAMFADACERTVRSGAWSAPLDRAGRRVATRITYTCRFDVKG